jgi:hypothetical protein
MYKVIGSDNREYGPASEEFLRRWIAEGRANGGTQVQKVGDTGWRSLSSFPEFAEALAAGTAPPLSGVAATPAAAAGWSSSASTAPAGSPARSPGVDGDALAAELIARDVTLDIGACVQRSWELMQKNFWLVVAAWAVIFFVSCGVGAIPYVGFPASMVLGAVLLGGLHTFFLRLSRGEPASVADVFAGFGPAIGPLILCGVVMAILEGAGFLFLIIPGIYLVVCWHLSALVILDKKLEFWPAMELARKVVTHHWWAMFGLALVCVLLYFGGMLACCIGLFVTGPIATGAMVEGYRRLFEPLSAPATQAVTPAATPAATPAPTPAPTPGPTPGPSPEAQAPQP